MNVNVNPNQKPNSNGLANTKFEENTKAAPAPTTKKDEKLSPPWDIYYKKVAEILVGDPDIEVGELIDEDGKVHFDVASDNGAKIMALQKILKNDIKFGNVTLHINFLTVDSGEVTVDDWKTAFEGNEYFNSITSEAFGHPGPAGYRFALFTRDVIDFYNDDLTDYCGYAHMLPADIVREIIKDNGMIYPNTMLEPGESIEEE